MAHVEMDPKTREALVAMAELASGGVGGDIHIAPRRQCDHCHAIDGTKKPDGTEHWVFPYGVTAPNGTYYDHLCNPCTIILNIDFSPPPSEWDNYDPENDPDQPTF